MLGWILALPIFTSVLQPGRVSGAALTGTTILIAIALVVFLPVVPGIITIA